MVEICSTSSGVDIHHRLDSAHGIVSSCGRLVGWDREKVEILVCLVSKKCLNSSQ